MLPERTSQNKKQIDLEEMASEVESEDSVLDTVGLDDDDLHLVDEADDGVVVGSTLEDTTTGVTHDEDIDEEDSYWGSSTIRPKYEPILACDDDDDDEEEEGSPPKMRNMLGYAAHHGGPRFLPPEIKDNIDHFLTNTPTKSPIIAYVKSVVGSWLYGVKE
jgi:hypothetical protein